MSLTSYLTNNVGREQFFHFLKCFCNFFYTTTMSFFFLNDIFLSPWKYLSPCTSCSFIQHVWHFDSIMFIKIILCNMVDLQRILMNNTKFTYQRENKVIKSFCHNDKRLILWSHCAAYIWGFLHCLNFAYSCSLAGPVKLTAIIMLISGVKGTCFTNKMPMHHCPMEANKWVFSDYNLRPHLFYNLQRVPYMIYGWF